MPIKNYTTKIQVEKTLGAINGKLMHAGAGSITTLFDPARRVPIGIEFSISTKHGERDFRLPARIEAVHRVLNEQYEEGYIERRFASREQAARVGWRILLDWLDAQLAILETEMVEVEELLLPWMVLDGERTAYQVLEERRLALPSPEKQMAP